MKTNISDHKIHIEQASISNQKFSVSDYFFDVCSPSILFFNSKRAISIACEREAKRCFSISFSTHSNSSGSTVTVNAGLFLPLCDFPIQTNIFSQLINNSMTLHLFVTQSVTGGNREHARNRRDIGGSGNIWESNTSWACCSSLRPFDSPISGDTRLQDCGGSKGQNCNVSRLGTGFHEGEHESSVPLIVDTNSHYKPLPLSLSFYFFNSNGGRT